MGGRVLLYDGQNQPIAEKVRVGVFWSIRWIEPGEFSHAESWFAQAVGA
jgi:hypothetical protein